MGFVLCWFKRTKRSAGKGWWMPGFAFGLGLFQAVGNGAEQHKPTPASSCSANCGGAASVGFVHRAPAASLAPEIAGVSVSRVVPTATASQLQFWTFTPYKAQSLCWDAALERSLRRGEVSHSPSGAQLFPSPPNWFFESFFSCSSISAGRSLPEPLLGSASFP